MLKYLRDLVDEQVIALRGLWRNKRQMTVSVLNLAMIVFSALMIWKAVMVFTVSESPVVVVLSGSMEPAFQRGDILFLDNRGGADAIRVGDIVVFKIAGRDVPIVHRVHRRHDATRSNGENSTNSMPPPGSAAAAAPVAYLTKGDANVADDRDLYAPGQLWLTRGEIVGKAALYVPYLGMFTILLNDYPVLKVGLLGLMGLFVLTGKET